MTVHVDARRTRWVFDFVRAGTRRQGYCEHPETGAAARNKTEAKQIERALVAQVEPDIQKSKPAQIAPHGFPLAKALREDLEISIAEQKAVENKRTYVATLVGFFGRDRRLDDIDEDDIERFVVSLRQQPVRSYKSGPRKRTPGDDEFAIVNGLAAPP